VRRRELIAGLGSTAAAWSFAARAQQPSTRRIGVHISWLKHGSHAETAFVGSVVVGRVAA
jgi:hypothetical protein